MLKKTLYISQGAYLSTWRRQLVIRPAAAPEVQETFPIEDLALILLEDPQITISHRLIQLLGEHNVALISCNANRLPAGLLLPLAGHSEMSARWQVQTAVSTSLKNQLWKQTVSAKITNQRNLLQANGRASELMDTYLAEVQPGDVTNREGKAASHYWNQLLPNFKRDPDGDPPNHYFNFGYAILRSIVARAIVGSGLAPVFGLFHHNKYNPYCLADDLMEPYRPYVDQRVLNWLDHNPLESTLTKPAKIHLLDIATADVFLAGRRKPLFNAVSSTTASLFKCFKRTSRQLSYPIL